MVLAVFAAYVNKSLILNYIIAMNLAFIVYRMSQSTLFRDTRGENSPKLNTTSNWLREFVDIIFKTTFNYFFIDLMHEGFGWYMNVVKLIDTTM